MLRGLLQNDDDDAVRTALQSFAGLQQIRIIRDKVRGEAYRGALASPQNYARSRC